MKIAYVMLGVAALILWAWVIIWAAMSDMGVYFCMAVVVIAGAAVFGLLSYGASRLDI